MDHELSSSDEEIDHEIIRRNTMCYERREDQRLHIGTPGERSISSISQLRSPTDTKNDGDDSKLKTKVGEMIKTNRAAHAFEQTPIITIEMPETSTETDYFTPGSKSAQSKTTNLMPAHNMSINTEEGPIEEEQGEEHIEEDDSIGARKSTLSMYKRTDTSGFQKAVVRAHAHNKAIDTLRGWMGIGASNVDDNMKFLREQVRQHRTDVPPLIQAAIAEELLPILKNISRTYRSVYPTQTNPTGWNLAVAANKKIQELEDRNKHLCVKSKRHKLNQLFNLLGINDDDARGTVMSEAYSYNSEDDTDDFQPRPRMSTQSRISRTSKLSILRPHTSRMGHGPNDMATRKKSIFTETKNLIMKNEVEHGHNSLSASTHVPRPNRSTTGHVGHGRSTSKMSVNSDSGRRTQAKAGLSRHKKDMVFG